MQTVSEQNFDASSATVEDTTVCILVPQQITLHVPLSMLNFCNILSVCVNIPRLGILHSYYTCKNKFKLWCKTKLNRDISQHCAFWRYSLDLHEAMKEGLRKAVVGGATGGVFWLLNFCTFALAFWYGAKLTRDDCLDPGVILQVFIHSQVLPKFQWCMILLHW